jgi:Thioesterase-like superfamily
MVRDGGQTAGVDVPSALYQPTDDGYLATALTIGPWDGRFQHAGPPAALLARAAEQASGIEGGQTVRLTYDIFAPVPVGPVHLTTSVVRAGRRIELVQAVLYGEDRGAVLYGEDRGAVLYGEDRGAVLGGEDERPLMRLSAWRMRSDADGPADADPGPHPAPAAPGDSRPEVAEFFTQDVAYHRALEWRFATGSFNAPGPAAAWTRPSCELVEGEPMTPLQHLLVMTDAASGISATLDWTTASFANVDLTLNLHRPPRGEWLGMDAKTLLGGTGAGQCFAVLYDEDGGIGRSSASLFVEQR